MLIVCKACRKLFAPFVRRPDIAQVVAAPWPIAGHARLCRWSSRGMAKAQLLRSKERRSIRDAIFALSTEADSIEIYALRKATSVPASPSKLDQSLVLGVLAQCWRRLSNGLKALPEFFRRPRLII
jgi:hypothetical protein